MPWTYDSLRRALGEQHPTLSEGDVERMADAIMRPLAGQASRFGPDLPGQPVEHRPPIRISDEDLAALAGPGLLPIGAGDAALDQSLALASAATERAVDEGMGPVIERPAPPPPLTSKQLGERPDALMLGIPKKK